MACSRLCLLAGLCSLLILTIFVSSTRSASCCVQYSRRPLPCRRLIDYTRQTIKSSCDINAVIFRTRTGFACANPSEDWTKRRIKCIEWKKWKDGQRGNHT